MGGGGGSRAGLMGGRLKKLEHGLFWGGGESSGHGGDILVLSYCSA